MPIVARDLLGGGAATFGLLLATSVVFGRVSERVGVPIAALPVLRPHDPGERDLLTTANDCCVYVVGRLAARLPERRSPAAV